MSALRDLVQWLAGAGLLALALVLLAGLVVRAHERWLDWRCDRDNQQRRKICASPEYQYWYRLLYVAPNEEELAELRAWRTEHGFDAPSRGVQP